jgi:hypothetical protein
MKTVGHHETDDSDMTDLKGIGREVPRWRQDRANVVLQVIRHDD